MFEDNLFEFSNIFNGTSHDHIIVIYDWSLFYVTLILRQSDQKSSYYSLHVIPNSQHVLWTLCTKSPL